MELGEKIRRARLEAGLTQRALCGDIITRSMLSQIESGKARPSMGTLQYLARRLDLPVGYFLDENTAVSPNAERMTAARDAYAARDHRRVLEILAAYEQPDGLFDQEYKYLMALSSLAWSKALLEQAEPTQGVALLEQMDRTSIYYREDMERQRHQLLSLGYEALERYYKEREDYQQAYYYACKRRS